MGGLRKGNIRDKAEASVRARRASRYKGKVAVSDQAVQTEYVGSPSRDQKTDFVRGGGVHSSFSWYPVNLTMIF